MPDEKVAVEIWKKIVDVQQHFNDLELRIRNFALIVTGAFLAFGGAAIREASRVTFFGASTPIASLIVFAAILPLLAFYFMDKYWYHRLLDGAVRAGAAAEKDLQSMGYNIELGASISASSPIPNWIYGKKDPTSYASFLHRRQMHSKHKMDVFYGILLLALVMVGTAIAFGVEPAAPAIQAATQPA